MGGPPPGVGLMSVKNNSISTAESITARDRSRDLQLGDRSFPSTTEDDRVPVIGRSLVKRVREGNSGILCIKAGFFASFGMSCSVTIQNKNSTSSATLGLQHGVESRLPSLSGSCQRSSSTKWWVCLHFTPIYAVKFVFYSTQWCKIRTNHGPEHVCHAF